MGRRKLYALLVGINKYKRPLIPNLKETHKDVDKIYHHLKKTYQNSFDLKIKVLKDKAATRTSVIKEIEQHLGKAKANDVVFFFFAGHGSWQKRNEKLKKFYPRTIERTLVCHDSRTSKKYDLSEVELLVLLDYVGRNQSEMIVVIDACHARGFQSHVGQSIRLFEGINRPRKIEHYLYDTSMDSNKFYYYKEVLRYKKIKNIPKPTYVGFYACDDEEYAQRNDHGGRFTQGLIDSLSSNQAPQNYIQVHDAVLNEMHFSNQTPTFKTYNGFNVNKLFINGQASTEKNKRFKVFKDKKKTEYTIQFGAQLGFPFNLDAPILFQLFSNNNPSLPIGTGEVEFIGLKSSPIHLSLPSMKYEESYWAEVKECTIAPMLVGFMGIQEDLEQLQDAAQERDIEQIVFVGNSEAHRFYLKWEETQTSYRLYEKGRSIFILEFAQTSINDDEVLNALMTTLEHLAQWQRMIDLSNPSSEILSNELVLTFKTPKIDDTKAVQCLHSEPKTKHLIQTDLKSANEYPQKPYSKILLNCEAEESFDYEVGITNTSFSQDYYVACLLISANYGVFPLYSNITLLARQSIDNIIDPNYGTLMIGREEDTEISNYLKVLVSRERLPTIEGFMLGELELERWLEDSVDSRTIAEERVRIFDWQALGLEFCLGR